uniref:Uncharacterized protein n=1 Tax=Chromera velia CCMP2878 TaxID=1169474 RepID=A0A0G4HCT9_9ALVE|eukprot:Cvel_6368.t1-p1 / transcript=Cvel_6368.t1 / gene=Cvel_6368 / organism=Chromera_velia_CCMP2878 / gene_product=hypothetical protein / transcript_product=hypothetical protein / location=Cvel_scaffold310:11596-11880(-) / protein_length=95 / sequence_SO=supercontig / SO=protein_coding / is_pseudo=false
MEALCREWEEVRSRLDSGRLPKLFLLIPSPDDFDRPFVELSGFICERLELPPEYAVNAAVRENVLGVLLAIETDSMITIVGTPGSSKSSAVDILC